ncbi:hypothetical protein MA20_47935 [Bradyrhizobium japonicum]|uniref:Uncharacterized protein n=1 Tax=Bradyrhizobium japonicum TaxID=375 RepID=A0A0A3XEJ8_BRAJP|nr:hypothetical protein MA20_47935 [Bradyrhizobium japonicum]
MPEIHGFYRFFGGKFFFDYRSALIPSGFPDIAISSIEHTSIFHQLEDLPSRRSKFDSAYFYGKDILD